MGIEDLSVDSTEHVERILIVGSYRDTANKLARLLAVRKYATVHASSAEEAARAAVQQLFDLIIVDHQDSTQSPLELLGRIKGDSCLRRFPLLLLCPAEAPLNLNGTEQGNDLQILHSPFEPSALLVKVATQLRLRKLKYDQAGFEARIAAQNAELRDLTNRFQRELLEARQIQHAILPNELPSAEGAAFAAYYVPLEAVGGDLFDIWKISAEEIGMFIADVTGHGLPAAFIGAMTKMALAYAPKTDPSAMLRHINDGLCPHMPEGRFVTAAAAYYNPQTRSLRVARAGHPVSYIARAGGELIQVGPRGIALGIAPGVNFELCAATLAPGDKFLMVTDGLTETINMDGCMWGTDQVGEAFKSLAAVNPIDSCLTLLIDEQNRFSGGRVIRDDVTMLGLECCKA